MSAPYTVKLDAESARELAARGGTILLLDVPEHTAVGIDQQTFLVGPKFKGVKMVPPGTHLVSYSAASGQGDFGPTTSFFVPVRAGQVVVRRWNAASEVLEQLADEDEVARFMHAVKTFQLDQFLAPYDLSSHNRWRQLSGHISAAVVDAVQPVGGNICALAEADPGALRPATAAEQALDEQLQQGRAAAAAAAADATDGMQEGQAAGGQGHGEQQGGGQQPSVGAAPASASAAAQAARWAAAPHAGRCFYTDLPRLVKRGGISPQELTALNLDKSRVLEEVLAKRYQGSEDALLGEFQFAFLAFLVGQSLEGFAQWRAFLALMLACDDAPLGARAPLFAAFLKALHAQLEHGLGGGGPGAAAGAAAGGGGGPLGEPLIDELLQDSFLRRLAAQFFQMLHEERGSVSPELAEQAAAVSGVLQRSLGWGVRVVTALDDSEEEEDEDGPVVVEGVELPPDA